MKKTRKEIKQAPKPTINLMVTENSLRATSEVDSRLINISIAIICGETTTKIRFKYDMDEDTPESVAQEMRQTLGLPEDYIIAVQDQIRNTIQNYMNELYKSVDQVPGNITIIIIFRYNKKSILNLE